MGTLLKTYSIALCFALISTFSASAQSAPPRIFFSDLESGPKTGGENNNGVYVTLWGKNFGTTRGSSSVTVGGGAATTFPVWSDSKITFQLGPSAATGNIVVTVGGQTSNGIPFTVRSGNIYFVSTSGSDSSSGSFSAPWSTVKKAKNSLAAGDTVYVMNGVSQTGLDDYSSSLAIRTGGTAASPIALVAYPNATVTIGSSSMAYGLRTPAVSGSKDYWVISGINLRGVAAMDLLSVTGWRVIGNDFSCPTGSGQSACFHTDTTNYLKFWGNYVHDVGNSAGSIDKYYHAVYFTTNSNHIDAGWNTIVPNPTQSKTSGGCRAMQFYSTGGSDQYDLHVHDNLIHDAICDGINFATINPSKGTVEAYNNVVYRVGTGPDPTNGSSNYACVLTASSSGPSVAVEVYNNTFYDCGSRGTSDSGTYTLYTPTRLRNNIAYQLSNEVYVGKNSNNPTGSNNLWYGVGNGPSQTTSNINANPLLGNLAGFDFHLQVGSPAKDSGTAISTLTTDRDGIQRPQAAGYDIGAYEYFAGTIVSSNPCDLNGDGVVNNADVTSAINQALGTAGCSTANLSGGGTCTVVDVQRVINASLGQSCRVGL
jgi:hypothetical protein